MTLRGPRSSYPSSHDVAVPRVDALPAGSGDRSAAAARARPGVGAPAASAWSAGTDSTERPLDVNEGDFDVRCTSARGGAPMSTNALPTQSTDFPGWYGEVVRRAELAENSAVRGAMVIKPYGYAIWEAIQRALDDRIKATGHENLYFPLFVPASVLAQEGELVKGFAPEVAVVTEAGGQAPRRAAGGASDLGGADLVDVRPLGAVLPRPAAALQPVGERRPLGAQAPPVPAHERVPVAGRPHGARDRGRGDRRDADDPPRRLRRHDRERARHPRAARAQERERAVSRAPSRPTRWRR